MSSRLLTATRTADFTPLGTTGQRAFEVIRREVAPLGPAFEQLFAEPFAAPEGDMIDWYATATGPVSLLDAAPEPQCSRGRAQLDQLVVTLTRRAEALMQESDGERRRLGEALRNAVEVPDDSCVYLVGDQPVLVCWAHHRNVAQPKVGVLTARVPTPVSAAAPEMPPELPPEAPGEPALAADSGSVPPRAVAQGAVPGREPMRFTWLWWLLWGTTGVLAGVVAWLLLPACGIVGVGWLDWCPRPVVSAVATETARGAALEREVDRLQRQLQLANLDCRPEQQAMDCPRPPSEVALLLDASLSMAFGIDTPLDVEQELFEIVQRQTGSGAFASNADAQRFSELIRSAQGSAMGEPRIDLARRAIDRALDGPAFTQLRVGSFAACGELALSESLTDAAAARAHVAAIELAGFTALAFALEQAAASLEGGRAADDPVTIILISDGYDTCGGDPCAAAHTAKAARPGLQIDVVDLVGLPNLRCVAEATGGRYLEAAEGLDADALAATLGEAMQRDRPSVCPQTGNADRAALDLGGDRHPTLIADGRLATAGSLRTGAGGPLRQCTVL